MFLYQYLRTIKLRGDQKLKICLKIDRKMKINQT